MKRIRVRPTRIAAACTIAARGLVGLNVTPAFAVDYAEIPMYGVSGRHLGYGAWSSPPYGGYGNGWIEVEDSYCDGDSGIIAAISPLDRGRP